MPAPALPPLPQHARTVANTRYTGAPVWVPALAVPLSTLAALSSQAIASTSGSASNMTAQDASSSVDMSDLCAASGPGLFFAESSLTLAHDALTPIREVVAVNRPNASLGSTLPYFSALAQTATSVVANSDCAALNTHATAAAAADTAAAVATAFETDAVAAVSAAAEMALSTGFCTGAALLQLNGAGCAADATSCAAQNRGQLVYDSIVMSCNALVSSLSQLLTTADSTANIQNSTNSCSTNASDSSQSFQLPSELAPQGPRDGATRSRVGPSLASVAAAAALAGSAAIIAAKRYDGNVTGDANGRDALEWLADEDARIRSWFLSHTDTNSGDASGRLSASALGTFGMTTFALLINQPFVGARPSNGSPQSMNTQTLELHWDKPIPTMSADNNSDANARMSRVSTTTQVEPVPVPAAAASALVAAATAARLWHCLDPAMATVVKAAVDVPASPTATSPANASRDELLTLATKAISSLPLTCALNAYIAEVTGAEKNAAHSLSPLSAVWHPSDAWGVADARPYALTLSQGLGDKDCESQSRARAAKLPFLPRLCDCCCGTSSGESGSGVNASQAAQRAGCPLQVSAYIYEGIGALTFMPHASYCLSASETPQLGSCSTQSNCDETRRFRSVSKSCSEFLALTDGEQDLLVARCFSAVVAALLAHVTTLTTMTTAKVTPTETLAATCAASKATMPPPMLVTPSARSYEGDVLSVRNGVYYLEGPHLEAAVAPWLGVTNNMLPTGAVQQEQATMTAAVAALDQVTVPTASMSRRMARDGPLHHITLAHPLNFRYAAQITFMRSKMSY